MQQQSLFDLSQYVKKKKERGKYKPKEPKQLNQYEEMALIYNQISNYLPIPILSMQQQEAFEFGHLRLWYSQYTSGSYDYYNEECQGEDFKIIGAELIGTENFYIEYRLKIHKKLLELIDKGLNIQEAANILQPLINKLKGVLEADYGKEKI